MHALCGSPALNQRLMNLAASEAAHGCKLKHACPNYIKSWLTSLSALPCTLSAKHSRQVCRQGAYRRSRLFEADGVLPEEQALLSGRDNDDVVQALQAVITTSASCT